MTCTASFLISHFSKHTVVALSRYHSKSNPLIDPKATMGYASFIPTVAAIVRCFPSRTSAESYDFFQCFPRSLLPSCHLNTSDQQ